MRLIFCVCTGVDPSNMLKIVIGPVICVFLLLLMGGVGFFMFKKKYVSSLIFITNVFPALSDFIHFVCRQTEGPTGRLYTSPNPEYFSPDEGEQHSVLLYMEEETSLVPFGRIMLRSIQIQFSSVCFNITLTVVLIQCDDHI